MRTVILMVLFCLSLPLAAFAHDEGGAPAAPPPPLKETMAAIEAAVAGGTDVHELTEAAAAGARTEAGAPGEADPRRAAALRQFLQRLEALHAVADKHDTAAMAAEFKKLQSAYRLLAAQTSNEP